MFNHQINNVGELHTDSVDLYTNTVVGKADSIISDLSSAVENLKTNWKGADAGVNIQTLIETHNEIVDVRNDLARLARDSSKVASNYRDIQIANNAPLDTLSPVNITEKTKLGDHSDTADTININGEAEIGKNFVISAKNNIESFVSEASRLKGEILGNWTVGTGREQADESFGVFETNSKAKKEKLEEVANIISDAIKNYQF